MQAQRACTEAAQATVKLLQLYRKQHTLRRTNVQIVHLVFTASLIHIYNTCSTSGRAAEKAMADLQFCTQALGEIGTAYKNSSRALEVVICIRLEWQRTRNGLRLKRPRSSRDVNTERMKASEQRKRRATGDNQKEVMVNSMPATASNMLPQSRTEPQGELWSFSYQPDHDIDLFGQWGDDYPILDTFPRNIFASSLYNAELPNTNVE